jgi:hypothetical protein
MAYRPRNACVYWYSIAKRVTLLLSKLMPHYLTILFLSCTLSLGAQPGIVRLVDRILGDDTTGSKSENQFLAVPMVFYTPETSLAFGPAAFYSFRTDKADYALYPSFLRLFGFYTLQRQWYGRLDGELWWAGNKWRWRGDVSYSIFPLQYWGVGNHSPAAHEERYSQNRQLSSTEISRKLIPTRKTYLGLYLELNGYAKVEPSPGGIMEAEGTPGINGGRVHGAGAILSFDSRDRQNYPLRGWYRDLMWVRYGAMLGGEYTFHRIRTDLRYFQRIHKHQVLAFQFFGMLNTGDVPFQMMAQLGHDERFRGIYGGRYLDHMGWSFQTEYRMPIWWRFGVTGFASMGRVGESLSELAELGGLHFGYGGGLRFMFNRQDQVNLRMDVAHSPGLGVGYYFTLREAF